MALPALEERLLGPARRGGYHPQQPRRARLIPAYKLGRVIRIKREDAETFLEERRIEPGSLPASARRISKMRGEDKVSSRRVGAREGRR